MLVSRRAIYIVTLALFALSALPFLGDAQTVRGASVVLRPRIRPLKGGWVYIVDTLPTGPPEAWVTFRKHPEVIRALLETARESTTRGDRLNAILRLGGTGEEQGYRYLAATIDSLSPTSDLRSVVLIAMGNGYPDRPPEYIYHRLEIALSSRSTGDRFYAAVALGDIMSPRAMGILRSRAAFESSPSILREIRHGISRTQKP